MADSPTEHFDHAEHAQHALHLGDPFLSKVSITIAILAVIAATVGSLETLETAAAIGDKNAAVLLQNRVTDNWNFYQAKSIKKHLYTLNAANGGPLAQDFKKQAEGYGAEEQELFAKGQALEHQTEEKLKRAPRTPPPCPDRCGHFSACSNRHCDHRDHRAGPALAMACRPRSGCNWNDRRGLCLFHLEHSRAFRLQCAGFSRAFNCGSSLLWIARSVNPA
jgi:hypothetical protein